VATEVHEDSLKFRPPLEADHKIRLEEVDHPDVELLCRRLYHPSR